MRKIALLFIALVTSQIYSQISFEKGYIVDNNNQRKDCYIKNIEWASNPEEIEYKLNENGEILKGNLSNLNEFGIDNSSNYVKFTFELDVSSDNINQISTDKAPVLTIVTSFLKVLVKGEVTLYQYSKNSLNRYYFSKDGSNPEPLIYKKYRVSELKNSENTMFRNQIWNIMKDSGIKLSEVNNLSYNYTDLSKLFIKYNNQNNSLTIDNTNKNKSILNLYIKSGLILSSFEVRNINRNTAYQYENTTQPYVGFEAEFILGINKNKWAVVIDPSFSRFKGEYRNSSNEIISSIDYAAIDIPIGIRYNTYLNDKSRIFINTFYLFDFPLKIDAYSQYNFNNEVYDLKWMGSATDFEAVLGLGYNYDNKFSFEMRYCFNNNVLNRMRIFNTDYATLSLIVGYKIFQHTKRK